MNFMNGRRLSSPLPFLKSSVSFSFLYPFMFGGMNYVCDFVGIHEAGLMEEGQWLGRRDYCLGHWERLCRDDITLRTRRRVSRLTERWHGVS